MEIRKSKVYLEPDDKRHMDYSFYKVTKTGYVLSQQEDYRWTPIWRKSNDKVTDPLQGFQYYQISGNTTACAQCQEHIGAIYPTASAVEGKTKPPFPTACVRSRDLV